MDIKKKTGQFTIFEQSWSLYLFERNVELIGLFWNVQQQKPNLKII